MDMLFSPDEHRLSPPKKVLPEHPDALGSPITHRDIDRFAAELDLEEYQDAISELASIALREGSQIRNEALLRRVNTDLKDFFDSIPSASALPANLPDHYAPFDPGAHDDPDA